MNKSFDKSLIIVALLLSIALGIRNTSIIGWIPLLLIQMIKTKSFTNFLKAGIFVALPALIIIIGIDSIFYG